MRNNGFPVKSMKLHAKLRSGGTQPKVTEPNRTLTEPKGGVRTQTWSVGERGFLDRALISNGFVPPVFESITSSHRMVFGKRIVTYGI